MYKYLILVYRNQNYQGLEDYSYFIYIYNFTNKVLLFTKVRNPMTIKKKFSLDIIEKIIESNDKLFRSGLRYNNLEKFIKLFNNRYYYFV